MLPHKTLEKPYTLYPSYGQPLDFKVTVYQSDTVPTVISYTYIGKMNAPKLFLTPNALRALWAGKLETWIWHPKAAKFAHETTPLEPCVNLQQLMVMYSSYGQDIETPF